MSTMLNLNVGGQILSGKTNSGYGFNLNVKVNQNASLASVQKLPSNLQAQKAAASSRTSVDKIFENLYEENSMGNVNLLSKLSYKVETNGDSDDFANYIRAFALDGSMMKNLSDYDAEGIVTTIAAKYASLSHQIEEGNFSESSKQKMQQELDLQLEAGLKDLADYYGDSASSLFDSLGISSQKNEIGKALTEFVHEKKDEMLAFMKSDEGKEYLKKAQLKDEKNNFLFDDVALTKALVYHAAEQKDEQEKLKEAQAQEQAKLKAANAADGTATTKESSTVLNLKKADANTEAQNTNASFTLNDLNSLGKLQSTLSSFVTEDKSKSEEELGYQLSLTMIKGQEILKQNGASDYLSNLFTKNFENFVDGKVKDINEYLKDKQKDAEEFSTSNPEAYKEFDTKVVLNAFKATTSVYELTGNAKDAMVNGFDLVKNSFEQNQQLNGSVIRYQNDNFFSNFFHTNKDQDAYNMGMSTFRRYYNELGRI